MASQTTVLAGNGPAPIYEPIAYPIGSSAANETVPNGFITPSQAKNAARVVGSVGGRPIVALPSTLGGETHIMGGNGFLAELIPRMEGLFVTLIFSMITLMAISPKKSEALANVIINGAIKIGDRVLPNVIQSTEKIVDNMGKALDKEFGWNTDPNQVAPWWCMFGLGNAFIPACRNQPIYCIGPLGLISSKCRQDLPDISDLESEVENKFNEWKSILGGEFKDFENEAEALGNEVLSDVVDRIDAGIDGALSDLESPLRAIESEISDLESDVESIF